MSEIDVNVSNLVKQFGSFTAVDNVSFSIPKGNFFSLLGPSGCGKTTIMRMISGFEPPTSGTIEIAGEDMTGKKPFERPTNLVFQHLSLFPHMTVAKNIGFGLEMRGESKSEIVPKVANMLDLVQLGAHGDRKISQLSGGQRQRVAIARALVNRPTVLLLDEPLGALDLKLREQMQLELKRIQREVGTTFIYVTHDQKEAITMSNKIAVINKGRVEQLDDAGTIYENPKTAFVAGFIGDTNLLKGEYQGSDNGLAVVKLAGDNVRVPIDFEISKNAPILVSVRPERMDIQAADATVAGGENSLLATVEDVIYLGSLSHYRLLLSDGTGVTVEVQNSGTSGSLARGSQVAITWAPEHSRTFDAKES